MANLGTTDPGDAEQNNEWGPNNSFTANKESGEQHFMATYAKDPGHNPKAKFKDHGGAQLLNLNKESNFQNLEEDMDGSTSGSMTCQ